MLLIFNLLEMILRFYSFVLVSSVIFSWLYAFHVVNPSHPIVKGIGKILYQLTEPLLRPIRSILPDFGSLDLSPLVVFFLIHILSVYLLPAFLL